MVSNLINETWEAFFIEQQKIGLVHRVTTRVDASDLLVTHWHIAYGSVRFQHSYYFYDQAGYPSHSFIYDANDGAPIYGRFINGQLVCQVDEDVFVEAVTANARPTIGSLPLVITIPFVEGHRQSFPVIDEATGSIHGLTTLVSKGWENIQLNGQSYRLWCVREEVSGRSSNVYWLDEERNVQVTRWQGGVCQLVPGREEALNGLPNETITNALKLIDGNPNLEWTNDIEAWLNNRD